MKLAKRMWMAASVCAGTLLAASSAFAQEGDVRNAMTHGLMKWINFAIVAAIILWVFAKKLPPAFQKNADNISSAITKAAAVKAEADAKLRDAEAKLASLDKQIAELRAEAQRESAAEVERIHAMTRSDQEKIGAAAKAEIAAAERAARNDLKELAAKLAVDGAEAQLARELTPAVQESLISGFVNSLDGRPN
jgi:F-type H+-transporting ATPase subunit b